jgi:hypothetical protein
MKTIEEKLNKVFTDLAAVTEEIFNTDPLIIGGAVVNYLNTVNPQEDNEWDLSGISFDKEKIREEKNKEYPLLNQGGYISFENDVTYKGQGLIKGILGIQIAADGRVWICVNGISILRFRPKLKGGD